MRISHSGIELYTTCPQRYKYRYIDKIKDRRETSSFFFGSSIGGAIEHHLMLEKDIHDAFDELMQPQLNNPLSRYYKGDYHPELLRSEDWEVYADMCRQNGLENMDFEENLDAYKKEKCTKSAYYCMNYIFFVGLLRMGHKMLDTFIERIKPRIKHVYAMEEEYNLANGDGQHSIIGYGDIRCDFELEDGSILKNVILDFKTSSAKYKKNAVTEKQQLVLYSYIQDVTDCGFIVFLKQLGKNGADVQILIDKILPEHHNRVIAHADATLTNILNEKFDKCLTGCFSFGKLCEYSSLCNHGAMHEYLYVEEK